jgi:hypothetical protein
MNAMIKMTYDHVTRSEITTQDRGRWTETTWVYRVAPDGGLVDVPDRGQYWVARVAVTEPGDTLLTLLPIGGDQTRPPIKVRLDDADEIVPGVWSALVAADIGAQHLVGTPLDLSGYEGSREIDLVVRALHRQGWVMQFLGPHLVRASTSRGSRALIWVGGGGTDSAGRIVAADVTDCQQPGPATGETHRIGMRTQDRLQTVLDLIDRIGPTSDRPGSIVGPDTVPDAGYVHCMRCHATRPVDTIQRYRVCTAGSPGDHEHVWVLQLHDRPEPTTSVGTPCSCVTGPDPWPRIRAIATDASTAQYLARGPVEWDEHMTQVLRAIVTLVPEATGEQLGRALGVSPAWADFHRVRLPGADPL